LLNKTSISIEAFAYLSNVYALEWIYRPYSYYAILQYGKDYICSGLKGR